MSPVSSILTISLAGLVSAYPSLGSMGERGPAGMNKLTNRQVQTISAVNSSSASSSSSSNSPFPAWHPPQAGEVRGPCPALNTLANHDICPRSGKGYTVEILVECLAKGLNIGEDFSSVIGAAAMGSNPNPLLLSVDLDMLNRHDAFIEHDASLSRADASTGDGHSFNQTIWDTVLAYYNDSNMTTIPAAAKARYNRVLVEKARDPEFSFGPTQMLFQMAETALYLSAMGDPITGEAPIEYVRSLFEQERLPYELGWKPSTIPTTLASLVAMLIPIQAATGETIPDAITLSEDSLKAAFVGLNAATGEVANAAVHAVSKLTGALGSLESLL